MRDLQRLLEVARKLNGVGDLRSNADAVQALAREIAKLARALADAERALPAAARRGVPAIAVPQTRPVTAAGGTEAGAPEDQVPQGGASETGASETGVAGTGTVGARAVDDLGEARAASHEAAVPAAGAAGATPGAADDRAADDRAADTAELAGAEPAGPGQSIAPGADRGGTGALLKRAADMLKKMRETVRKAEAMENLIDPEAAKERRGAIRELDGYVAELNALALDFAEPLRGQGVDVTA